MHMHGRWAVAACLAVHLCAAAAAPPWKRCFSTYGETYHLSPRLLIAIARQESGLNPAARHRNRDGSMDLGLMQVNSSWLPTLSAAGVREQDLLDACTSIRVGAWILARAVARFGYSWEAVGAYNAGPSRDARRRRARYAQQVASHLLRDVSAASGGVRKRPATGIAEYRVGGQPPPALSDQRTGPGLPILRVDLGAVSGAHDAHTAGQPSSSPVDRGRKAASPHGTHDRDAD
jgi:Soluble lytic murein transglycosylase and related regulatory proteins (some contain LysM/invasin domains)